MAIKQLAKKIWQHPLKVFTQFPLTMAALCFFAVRLIIQEFTGEGRPFLGLDNSLWFTLPLCTAFLAFPAAFFARRIRAGKMLFFLLQAAALGLAAAWMLLLPAGENQSMLRLTAAFAFSAALALYIPCAKGEAGLGEVFMAHIRSALTAFVVVMALTISVFLVLAAIAGLFAPVDARIESSLLTLLWAVVLPGLYMNLLPEFHHAPAAKEPTRLSRLVTEISGLPMMGVATIVFLVYLGTCVTRGAWPVGALGPMVSVYALLGLTAYLLSTNFQDALAVNYRRLFPFALVLFVPLQLISIYLRVAPYGVTESRYYLALFALFSLISGLYLVIGRGRRIHVLPLVAALLIALSQLPAVGAYSISGQSQANRLEQLLTANDMLRENQIVPNAHASFADRQQITSVYEYLRESGHDQSIAYLPAPAAGYAAQTQFSTLFGFDKVYSYTREGDPSYTYFSLDTQKPMDISGYDTFIQIDLVPSESQPSPALSISGAEYSLRYEKGSKGQPVFKLEDAAGASPLALDTLPLMEHLFSKDTDTNENLPAEQLSVTTAMPELSARLILLNGYVGLNSQGEYSLFHGTGYLLVDGKKE